MSNELTTNELEKSVFLDILSELSAALLREDFIRNASLCRINTHWKNQVCFELKFLINDFQVSIRRSRRPSDLSIRYTHSAFQGNVGKFRVSVANPNYLDRVLKIIQRLEKVHVNSIIHDAIAKETDE